MNIQEITEQENRKKVRFKIWNVAKFAHDCGQKVYISGDVFNDVPSKITLKFKNFWTNDKEQDFFWELMDSKPEKIPSILNRIDIYKKEVRPISFIYGLEQKIKQYIKAFKKNVS